MSVYYKVKYKNAFGKAKEVLVRAKDADAARDLAVSCYGMDFGSIVSVEKEA